jgi:hypothetical protein
LTANDDAATGCWAYLLRITCIKGTFIVLPEGGITIMIKEQMPLALLFVVSFTTSLVGFIYLVIGACLK